MLWNMTTKTIVPGVEFVDAHLSCRYRQESWMYVCGVSRGLRAWLVKAAGSAGGVLTAVGVAGGVSVATGVRAACVSMIEAIAVETACVI
jgi:hypothetical protein